MTEATEAFSFQVLILLTLCSQSPSVLHLPVMLIRDESEPRLGVRAIYSFSFTVVRIQIEYLRLINYQPSGLHASRTHHLHLYAETAELRTRIELAV
jgi:hypothetical protein